MSNLFQNNSYNVLGLDTSATQKDINTRAKKIINLLKVDEKPTFETDLDLVTIARKESTVKEAAQKLSSPTQRVSEYFFWFDIESDYDEKALQLLKDHEIEAATSLWETQASKQTAQGFIAKKNLAILSSLLVLKTGQKKHLTLSIGHWKDLVLSEKFWSHFEKLYALNDEVGTSKSTLETFSKNITDELSDFYTDVSELHKDRSFYSLFSQVFSTKGTRIQQNVLDPILEAIHDASEKLKNLNISEDNIISDDEVATVKRLTGILKGNFDKLKELGLYGDSQSKTVRDNASESLRVVAMDLYHNLNESKKPVALLNIAASIAGTVSLQNKISNTVELMRKNIADEKIVIPINELLGDEKFVDALDLIEKQKEKHKSSKALTEYFAARIQWCVTGIAAKDYEECMQQFNAGKFTQAQENFSGLREFILSYLHYFDFDKESLDGVLLRIENLTSNPKAIDIDNIQTYRNQILEGASETFKDKFEASIIVFLIDCSIYSNLSTHLPAIRRKNTLKKWAWYIVIGIVLLVVFGSSSDDSNTSTGTPSSGSSSGSSSSAYDTCKAEYDSLKSQLASTESTMNRHEANGDTDSFNALVPQQNNLVQQGNAKATECNNLR